ncbi:hypothetical protein ABIC28_005113 [Rhodococcus sp. PvR044]
MKGTLAMSNEITTGNRAARRATRARHRRQTATQAATAVAVVAAALASGIGAAGAAPTQGGTTGGNTQGGTTTAPAAQPEAAPAPAAAPEAPPEYWVAPPAEYQNTEWRELPNYDYGNNVYVAPEDTYVAPVQIQELHLPTPVAPTAPIIAPRDKIRLGEVLIEQPNWISDRDAARTNGTSAVIESQVTDFWRSVGVDTTRAERMAAAQVAGGATGAIAGAAAAGVPAAVVGGLIGGTVGGNIGLGMGGVISVPLAPVPGLPAVVVVPTTVAGTAAGAAIGAAVAGVPAAAAGALIGGAAGVAAGTNFGAGDLSQPQEIKVPDVDQAAVTAQTETVLNDWNNSGPVGQAAAAAVVNTVETAGTVDQQARDLVTAQPGGEQMLEQVDQALNGFFRDATPGLSGNLISNAVGDGIAQHNN